jgi:DAK2 domain
MAQNRVDLFNLFSAVTKTLTQNQQSLDQADEYNHDHGSNMVQTFQTITSALQQKQGRSASTALTYAAKNLSKNTTSSSGKLYAQGLTQAASQLKGKPVDSRTALDLLQSLIGGGSSSTSSARSNMLASLFGQLMGGTSTQDSTGSSQPDNMVNALLGQLAGSSQPPTTGASNPAGDLLGSLLGQAVSSTQSNPSSAAQEGGDLLGNLLGSLTGGQPSTTGSSGNLDLGDILNAGMNYMQAKQHGVSTVEALAQAFMSASGMGNASHRTQSTSLVVNSFLKALTSSGKSQ